jgi:hypothetical protein
VKPTDPHPVLYVMGCNAELEQLAPADDAVLPRREPGDSAIR